LPSFSYAIVTHPASHLPFSVGRLGHTEMTVHARSRTDVYEIHTYAEEDLLCVSLLWL